MDDHNEEKLRQLGKSVNDMRFFQSLYKESTVGLPGTAFHNQHMNFYFDGDVSPIYLPSRLFQFYNLVEDIECFVKPSAGKENVKCEVTDSIVLWNQSKEAGTNLCNQIRRISQLQPISDMCILNIKCNDIENTKAFNMSSKARSVHMYNCVFPTATLDHLFQQISNSSSISSITFREVSLCHINSLQLHYLPSLKILCLWNTNLCRFHILHLTHLMENGKLPELRQINFGGNNLNLLKDDLGYFLKTISKHHRRNIVVGIQHNNLPTTFMKKITEHAKQPNILHLMGDDYLLGEADGYEDDQISTDDSENEEPLGATRLNKFIYETTQGQRKKPLENVYLADSCI